MPQLTRIGWSGVAAAVFGIGMITAAHATEQVIRRGEVSYVSGGIGVASQERLSARATEFNLKLVFTLTEGNYLADVGVTIKDDKGKSVVEHVTDGPFFMAKLPAGSYTVSAVFRDQPQSRKVKLGAALRTEYFRWPSDPKLDFVVAEAGERPRRAPAAQPGEVSFVSGGIGEAQQQELEAKKGEYNLKLVFTLTEGNYLADVNVVVTDATGKRVVEHLADGPLFMARLPAGNYAVAATYEGKTVTRKIKVSGGRLRTEYLRWASDPKTDLPVSRWLEK